LVASGYQPLVAPLMVTVPFDVDVPFAGDIAALTATSANALLVLGGGLPAQYSRLPFFAVGARTAEAARLAGATQVRQGAGSAHDLADLIAAEAPARSRILYLAGRVRKADLEQELEARGLIVLVQETYTVQALDTMPASLVDLLRSQEPAVMLHYSRRSAEVAVELAAAVGLTESFQGLSHRTLSKDVAEALQRAGAKDVIVSVRPDEDSLFATLPPCG
jgi:uroporphyrinogen-III synthase